MKPSDSIYIAGSNGMVGSAVVRRLRALGYQNLLIPSSRELDLRNQSAVFAWFEKQRPAYVFLAAAKVGGILANNTYRAEFLYDNLAIEMNVIEAARRFECEKLLFLGSSCIYPKMAPQPIREEYLLTGALEPTNEPYAIAKITGIKLAEAYRDQYGCNFISAMPTNLYGPNDNYHPENSHVLPALIRKCYTAVKENLPVVSVWGTGTPMREFLHVDDLADACVHMMLHYNERAFLNVGTGSDVTIRELVELVADVAGFGGELVFDSSKPDGTPRKLLDVSRINALGWKAAIPLRKGIQGIFDDLNAGRLVLE
jgi:GDP-L-fucose synthase